MSQLSNFRQHATEFNNLTDATVQTWLEAATLFLIEKKISPAKTDLAIALFAAHLAWCNKYPGNGGALRGPILNEKDDKKQKQYALIQNSDTFYGQSIYGQMFSNLTGIGGPRKAAILTRFGTDPYFPLPDIY